MGKFFARLRQKMHRFMEGRYGTDKLNMAILVLALVISVLALVLSFPPVSLILHLAAYALLGIALFRSFSRNIYRRYRENLRYLMLVDRFKDKEHKYFVCPKCRQPVRVPKGKGKIAITCPKCKEKFIRKT